MALLGSNLHAFVLPAFGDRNQHFAIAAVGLKRRDTIGSELDVFDGRASRVILHLNRARYWPDYPTWEGALTHLDPMQGRQACRELAGDGIAVVVPVRPS